MLGPLRAEERRLKKWSTKRRELLEDRIEQLLRDKESSQQAELARVMSLAKEAMQRMAETAAATASTRSTINVNSPTRPAGGPRANG